jgi:hypothetical protein
MPTRSRPSPTYREDVADVLSGLFSAEPGVREDRTSSGRRRWYVGRKLFAFLSREGVIVKLPADVVEELRGRPGYKPFEMRNKPVMKEWLVIDHADAAAYAADLRLFRTAIAFTGDT